MKFIKSAFLFAVVLLLQISLSAQEWVSYQSQEQINDLVDINGELLMATNTGLVIMDKQSFEKTIITKANSALSNNHIQAITQAPDGSSWIGTYDVVVGRVVGTDIEDAEAPDHEAYNQNTKLYDLEIAPNGDFWLGTSDGVFHKQGDTWLHYGEEELGPNFFEVWDIEFSENGDIYIAATDVHKYANGTWTNISEGVDLLNYLNADIHFSSTGLMYMTGDLNSVARYDGTDWELIDNGGLNGSTIVGLTEDTAGNIYFSTLYDGVYKLVGDTWIAEEDQQTEAFNQRSNFFYIDADNTRWLNDKIYLSRNIGGAIETTLIAPHTIETNNVFNIHKSENGSLYFLNSSDRNTAVLSESGEWSTLAIPMEIAFANILFDIHATESGKIYLATQNGLYTFEDNQWELSIEEPCRSFVADSEGKIYIRASASIYILDNNGVTEHYTVSNSPLSGEYINAHGVDANDNLWIAEGGINVIQKVSSAGEWTTYTETDYPAIGQGAGKFHFDASGNVWLPLDLVGALKFDGTNWTRPFEGNFDSIENLDVFSIESDATGKVYFSHQFGVTTLFEDTWENLIIEDVPFNYSHAGKMVFDNAGTLWWASSRYGVFTYTPENTTSINTIEPADVNFSVFPNPTDNYTVLSIDLKQSAEVNAVLFNQLGQAVLTENFGTQPEGKFQESIRLNSLPRGIYNLQIQMNNQLLTRRLFIQ